MGLTRVVSQAPTLFPEGLGTCEGTGESTCDRSAASSREKDRGVSGLRPLPTSAIGHLLPKAASQWPWSRGSPAAALPVPGKTTATQLSQGLMLAPQQPPRGSGSNRGPSARLPPPAGGPVGSAIRQKAGPWCWARCSERNEVHLRPLDV